MDNSIILVLSQALLYLKDPRVEQANKQLLKRKLASELVSDDIVLILSFLSQVIMHSPSTFLFMLE
jgi:hypothetical protein